MIAQGVVVGLYQQVSTVTRRGDDVILQYLLVLHHTYAEHGSASAYAVGIRCQFEGHLLTLPTAPVATGVETVGQQVFFQTGRIGIPVALAIDIEAVVCPVILHDTARSIDIDEFLSFLDPLRVSLSLHGGATLRFVQGVVRSRQNIGSHKDTSGDAVGDTNAVATGIDVEEPRVTIPSPSCQFVYQEETMSPQFQLCLQRDSRSASLFVVSLSIAYAIRGIAQCDGPSVASFLFDVSHSCFRHHVFCMCLDISSHLYGKAVCRNRGV